MKSLQDAAPILHFQSIRTVIDEDLGTFPFSSFEEKAFSAASLAQVHRAILPDNQQVAVKIQFPTLRMQTKWDLIVMKRIS